MNLYKIKHLVKCQIRQGDTLEITYVLAPNPHAICNEYPNVETIILKIEDLKVL